MSAGLLGAARVHAVTDYAELSRRINAAGLLKRRYAYYWCRMIGLISAFAGVWVTFAAVLVLYAALGTALILTLRAMARRWRAGDEEDVPYGPGPDVPASVTGGSG